MDNNKSFNNSLSVEEQAFEYIIPYYKSVYGDGFVDVRKDNKYQMKDIDFILNGITVEVKAFSQIFNNVFLFELKKGSDDYTTLYDGAFLTSKAENWLITDNRTRKGYYFKLKDLRACVYKLIANKELEGGLYKKQKNYEKDRPQLFKRILLVNQQYILENCKNQIINFL